MDMKESIQFLERLLTSDPYSEDIFLPIPKKDFTKINELLNREMGYPLDRLSGNIGGELYKSFKNSKEINDIIELFQQGEKYRQMWEELFTDYGMSPILSDEGYSHMLYKTMQELEQKYFPKKIGQDYKEGEE